MNHDFVPFNKKNQQDTHTLFTGIIPDTTIGQPAVEIPINNYLEIPGGRTLYGINKVGSCCDSSLKAIKLNQKFDHILSTTNKITTTVYPVQMASDHLPIIAEITL